MPIVPRSPRVRRALKLIRELELDAKEVHMVCAALDKRIAAAAAETKSLPKVRTRTAGRLTKR